MCNTSQALCHTGGTTGTLQSVSNKIFLPVVDCVQVLLPASTRLEKAVKHDLTYQAFMYLPLYKEKDPTLLPQNQPLPCKHPQRSIRKIVYVTINSRKRRPLIVAYFSCCPCCIMIVMSITTHSLEQKK